MGNPLLHAHAPSSAAPPTTRIIPAASFARRTGLFQVRIVDLRQPSVPILPAYVRIARQPRLVQPKRSSISSPLDLDRAVPTRTSRGTATPPAPAAQTDSLLDNRPHEVGQVIPPDLHRHPDQHPAQHLDRACLTIRRYLPLPNTTNPDLDDTVVRKSIFGCAAGSWHRSSTAARTGSNLVFSGTSPPLQSTEPRLHQTSTTVDAATLSTTTQRSPR